MAARYGFTPAPGTDYTRGREPEIARRLGRLARALRLRLIGLSGYRTPQHSVAVGGFSNDPHTRGEASDTPGIENVPESTLRRYGLTRPFPGAREANHIQLLQGASTRPTRDKRTDGPAEWLKQAGWPNRLIPTMVAIGGAESGWQIDATHTNDNGTTDDGWLQINSVHGYNRARLRSDPVYTARAGLTIYRRQGLQAWTTYTSGAYRSHLGEKPSGGFGRTRPGGETTEGGSVDTELATFFAPNLPGISLPNPLDLFKGASKAISGTTDFLKWIAWIFHPLNILRVVEFQVGFSLMVIGVIVTTRLWQSADVETAMQLIPAGRAAKAGRVAKPPAGVVK